MSRLRLAAAVSTVSIAAGVTALLVVPSAAASPALTWKDCAKDVQCATLTVPLDWRRGGATIGISLARRAATGNKIGTIVYLPGGPGDSGVQQLKAGPKVSPEVAERFDVISLDPRGVNESSPIRCDPAVIGGIPDVNPDTGAKYADIMAYSRKLADSCQARTGDTINHIDSADVARDVDALRAALGERQISVYSRSYGTLAAQMYAELFPGRVRAMVLDSVFDHSLDTREFLASAVRAAEDSFNAFAKWCAGSENCVLRGQDVSALFDDLYRRAERGELTEPSDPARKISATELSWTTMRRGFYNPSWKELSVRLAELAGQRPPTPAQQMPQTDFFPSAVLCADNRFRFRSEQEWTRTWDELKRIAPVMRTHMAWQGVSFCAGWPLPTTNPQHRPGIKAPVLILSSRHDPATPLEWAADVHRMIPGSALVTYEGSGHGVFLRNDCTKAATSRYFLDRVLPAPGTSCPGSDPA
ncbi:pimeloyl-ACP methyl ester carboxylesterase [Kibdelosporangium banguiense]|uniref:Pimeloyl-ACP methyl ester carboxylesterase n=1 Tax=Kibdelosporangium banguiense TaxID=1365924 RepID=A0ABS4TPK7_9PSEU|nr:alpha/beta hydrolase [Kibdelosporangium banguiense]MBP2326338.1 pimeloyl-ACP methyl ester carboxylesterase [Kibdelosporangium banguiense]